MSATVIVTGIKVEGKITGSSDVKVDGVVIGEIDLESSIYVSNAGRTEASIHAENVFIAGEHVGDIVADELIQISATGVVKGQLKAPYISIEKGAKFSGSIETVDDAAVREDSEPEITEEKFTVKKSNEETVAENDTEEDHQKGISLGKKKAA